MPLEYPVTRLYTVPRLTIYFVGVSIVAIVGLIIVNFIVQGYEVITVLRSDPNVTVSHWWRPKALAGWGSTGSCDPISLSGYSSFRTNSSMFSYEIRGIFDSKGGSIVGATSYLANPLSECEVEGVQFIGEPFRNRFQFDTPIRCTGPSIPFSLSLFSTFTFDVNPYHDDLSIYYSRNKPAWATLESMMTSNLLPLNASALTNVIGTIDALTADFAVAMMYEIRKSTGSPPAKITSGALFICPGGGTNCKSEDKNVSIPACQVDYSNGTMEGFIGLGPFLSPVRQSMINALVAVRDAYHIDLGNIRSSNTLLNKTAFDNTMKPDLHFVEELQSASPPGNMVCPVGPDCSVGVSWVQRLLASDPSSNVTIPTILPMGGAPAVIKLDYLCPSYKLKSPGSLLASVFIGTWSMYMALLGIFQFVGPMLERRYGRGYMGDSDPENHPSYQPAEIRGLGREIYPLARTNAGAWESSPPTKAWS